MFLQIRRSLPGIPFVHHSASVALPQVRKVTISPAVSSYSASALPASPPTLDAAILPCTLPRSSSIEQYLGTVFLRNATSAICWALVSLPVAFLLQQGIAC